MKYNAYTKGHFKNVYAQGPDPRMEPKGSKIG